ncbi:uncharacterized protein SETTUDRAFT_19631 [Exserohilum turcica Et28A]|uniref:Uncharacterized protein n=1 Tax=Exserohilum turcicum (strain 28A) TaxID=671987 RepID=R0IQD8_EXST2|nr:uncharacterized protein SETTUDRAFT_19631 [Exserohilum turcica Et28A]EOA87115.1 hypothetical protein SETTUDRAFT_19631 [Exserohilum turcica Et28A]
MPTPTLAAVAPIVSTCCTRPPGPVGTGGVVCLLRFVIRHPRHSHGFGIFEPCTFKLSRLAQQHNRLLPSRLQRTSLTPTASQPPQRVPTPIASPVGATGLAWSGYLSMAIPQHEPMYVRPSHRPLSTRL